MANSVVIQAVSSQGDNCVVTGTVNGASTSASFSRTVLNSLTTAVLAQQYLAFLLLHSRPDMAGTQLPITVTTTTINL